MNCEYIRKLQRVCAFIPCYLRNTGKVTNVCYKDGGIAL